MPKTPNPPKPASRGRLLATALAAAGLLAALGLVGALPGSRPAEPPFYLGGIQVNEADLLRWLDRLEASGMNTVSVTDYAHHGDWDSANLWFDDDIEGELREIRAAKARGMKVVLILRVALDHAFERNRFLWHGMIQPESEAEVEEWFRRYGVFARRWAAAAEREGVDVLMIASELNALTSTLPVEELPALEEYFLNPEKRQRGREEALAHQEAVEERHLHLPFQEGFDDLASYLDAKIAGERAWAAKAGAEVEQINRRRRLLERHWTGLIAELRGLYSGPLGYAANFDQYHEVGFWPELDVMGINAYFQLRRELVPGAAAEDLLPSLVEGWREVLGGIVAFRREQGVPEMPVIFTEMGYTRRANSTLEPWASTGFSLLPVVTSRGETDPASPAGEREGEAGAGKEPRRELVIWQEQPEAPQERALAVRTLWQVHRELPEPLLAGILYWKLSTVPSHRDIEPFVLLISEGEEDPLLPELQRFAH